MNKQEFCEKIAEKMKVPVTFATMGFNAVLNVATEALIKDHELKIRGFGTFTVKETKPKMVTNFKTGEKYQTEGSLKIVFTPGAEMLKALEARRRGIDIETLEAEEESREALRH